ncbi:hypothetical protein NIIDMKKI_09840 [Mycobacterium kansasii]|uniref:Pentapeptide repeats family protein n=1 Tax=Mycobacterium kansasii TaxID=1768 RepID=A0A7G1IBF1_MYCKA|nr:hypothetical protein NIIDMKKI_09840 [Mycobacterium kansasii]
MWGPNTGSWNAGDTNTGWFNPGNLNTGIANTGDVNTGGFNQGNLNNGFFWRGDGQGHAGFDYTLTIPAIALNLDVKVPLDIPITGHLGDIVIGSFTIPTLHLNGNNLTGTIGPIVVDPITISGPSVDLHVGGAGESLQLGISGPGVGPVVIPVLQVAAGPGWGIRRVVCRRGSLIVVRVVRRGLGMWVGVLGGGILVGLRVGNVGCWVRGVEPR